MDLDAVGHNMSGVRAGTHTRRAAATMSCRSAGCGRPSMIGRHPGTPSRPDGSRFGSASAAAIASGSIIRVTLRRAVVAVKRPAYSFHPNALGSTVSAAAPRSSRRLRGPARARRLCRLATRCAAVPPRPAVGRTVYASRALQSRCFARLHSAIDSRPADLNIRALSPSLLSTR